MILKLVLVIVGLQSLRYANATDYNFIIMEEGPVPCPGKEDIFIDKLFDLDHVKIEQIDGESSIVNGYATCIAELDPKLPIKLSMEVEQLNNGRWISTVFDMVRENICPSFFSKNEVWYKLVKDLKPEAKHCPPEKGTKFEFFNKSVSSVLYAMSPGLEGHYRVIIDLSNAQMSICVMAEGYVVKKRLSVV